MIKGYFNQFFRVTKTVYKIFNYYLIVLVNGCWYLSDQNLLFSSSRSSIIFIVTLFITIKKYSLF
jgi:hypothetical protein